MKTINYEHFKSLESLIDTMEQRPLNAVFKNEQEHLSSQRDETKQNGRFTGVNTYKDAMDVVRNGYKDPLEKMKKAILKMGEMDQNKRPRTKNDFIGFAPNVPNALNNIPINMINREKQQAQAKTIHLTYSFCALADVSTGEIIKGGINFISLVNSLEKQGFRVKIDILFISCVEKTASAFTVNLKEYGQQLNLLKLAFPLVHPAMLRRISFKWLETMQEIKDRDYIHGYGRTLGIVLNNNGNKEREFLEKNGILKGPNVYYCNVYQAMKVKSVEELAKEMKITKR